MDETKIYNELRKNIYKYVCFITDDNKNNYPLYSKEFFKNVRNKNIQKRRISINIVRKLLAEFDY